MDTIKTPQQYQSMLVIGGNHELRLAYCNNIIKVHAIVKNNIIEVVADEKTNGIGIEKVHNLQNILCISMGKQEKRIVIIHDINQATVPAQNALLKTIEEPVANTLLIMTAGNKQGVLETIQSRCTLITLKEQILPYEHVFDMRFFSLSLGKRLELAESLASEKQKALRWCDECIAQLRVLVRHEALPQNGMNRTTIRTAINKLIRVRQLLSYTQVNARLLLENLFIELPKVG